MFHDETLPSFFRRLGWSPDGSFLLVPAGIFFHDIIFQMVIYINILLVIFEIFKILLPVNFPGICRQSSAPEVVNTAYILSRRDLSKYFLILFFNRFMRVFFSLFVKIFGSYYNSYVLLLQCNFRVTR